MKRILFLFLVITTISLSASSLAPQDVIWTNAVNVAVNGNTLTGHTTNSWSAGAFSTQKIDAGLDGYFEMTAQETNTYRMGGLSSSDINAHYATIQYATYLVVNSHVRIYESGSYKGDFGTYQTGDVFRVAREGIHIKYYKNGSLFYTSATTTSSDLYADTSLYTYGATIYNARISSVPEPASLALICLGFLLVAPKFLRRS